MVCTNLHGDYQRISPDVIEIDGASNTGVDDIRDNATRIDVCCQRIEI
jgi:DNA polymerase III gamma/tau subunit